MITKTYAKIVKGEREEKAYITRNKIKKWESFRVKLNNHARKEDKRVILFEQDDNRGDDSHKKGK